MPLPPHIMYRPKNIPKLFQVSCMGLVFEETAWTSAKLWLFTGSFTVHFQLPSRNWFYMIKILVMAIDQKHWTTNKLRAPLGISTCARGITIMPGFPGNKYSHFIIQTSPLWGINWSTCQCWYVNVQPKWNICRLWSFYSYSTFKIFYMSGYLP